MNSLSEDVRKTINGELDRIAITDNEQEILDMLEFLKINIQKYADINLAKVKSRRQNHIDIFKFI